MPLTDLYPLGRVSVGYCLDWIDFKAGQALLTICGCLPPLWLHVASTASARQVMASVSSGRSVRRYPQNPSFLDKFSALHSPAYTALEFSWPFACFVIAVNVEQ